MGMVYLAARLIGRSLIPLAAVLLTASCMLFAKPQLIVEPGFQLTVVVTAALVRWVPEASQVLRGPGWLRAGVAVPLIAQTAAAPIVAWHFRSLVPGAVLSNLLVLPLVTPILVFALAAALTASLWPWFASVLLQVLSQLEDLLWWCGSLGRSTLITLPEPPLLLVLSFVVAGFVALRPGSRAKIGAKAWLCLMLVGAGWSSLRPPARADTVTLLPVAAGTSVLVESARGTRLLIDGGIGRDEASQLLKDHGIRQLQALVASHADVDHIGGLCAVLSNHRIDELIAPAWMSADAATVPLMRIARQRGTKIHFVSRGSRLCFGDAAVEALWPPVNEAPVDSNDRSLVAMIRLSSGRILLTGDTGKDVERRLASSGDLHSEVLVVSHHGSSSATSKELLDEVQPAVALIPAGPQNSHNHPSQVVLRALEERGISSRYPARHGWCGARVENGAWRAFSEF